MRRLTEALLVAHTTLLEISCRGSNFEMHPYEYVDEFSSLLHPREEKFSCYYGSRAYLGDLKSYDVLSYQWQVFRKWPVKYVILLF